MFTVISWKEYLLGISLLTFAYYLFIGLRYFSGSFKNMSLTKRKKASSEKASDIAGSTDKQDKDILSE